MDYFMCMNIFHGQNNASNDKFCAKKMVYLFATQKSTHRNIDGNGDRLLLGTPSQDISSLDLETKYVNW